MRSAGGAVRDRNLHFRYAPRRLCRSSLAPAHQAGALSPFIDNPRRNASSPATPLLARGRLRSLPCLRLVAPVENRARLGFAPLAPCVLALPRRSCRMVSCRAYSSPAPQPASRHSIKPFSIQPVIANIRRAAVSTSQYGWRLGTAVRRMAIRFFAGKTSLDLNSALLRMFAMMMRIICQTRVLLEGYGKSHSGTFCASRPLPPSPRAGRLFAACRATEKTEDATRFRRVGIPSRNVRLDQHGTEWNRPRNRCRHLRFFRNFGAQRRS